MLLLFRPCEALAFVHAAKRFLSETPCAQKYYLRLSLEERCSTPTLVGWRRRREWFGLWSTSVFGQWGVVGRPPCAISGKFLNLGRYECSIIPIWGQNFLEGAAVRRENWKMSGSVLA